MSLSIKKIREALRSYTPRDLPESGELAHAAVALVLREERGEPQVLMIRRAEHPQDPWSGQMGFPGGRVETRDSGPERTAVRETEEELGFSLDICSEQLGRLSEVRARAKARPIPLSIFPYICELTQPTDFQLNHEVIEALWIPLRFFLMEENRDQMPHPGDQNRSLPCYCFGEHVIWGLSLGMLEELLTHVLQFGSPESPERARHGIQT